MVFPGVDGPIITPIYEIMREGWEDYCILTALKEQGFNQLLDELIKESRQKKADLGVLRTKALQAFCD
jgi:predicted GTPase